jgi:hypothetical protein
MPVFMRYHICDLSVATCQAVKNVPGYGFSCFPTGDAGLQASRRDWEPRKTN